MITSQDYNKCYLLFKIINLPLTTKLLNNELAYVILYYIYIETTIILMKRIYFRSI
jgi:hypothetical protein